MPEQDAPNTPTEVAPGAERALTDEEQLQAARDAETKLGATLEDLRGEIPFGAKGVNETRTCFRLNAAAKYWNPGSKSLDSVPFDVEVLATDEAQAREVFWLRAESGEIPDPQLVADKDVRQVTLLAVEQLAPIEEG